MICYRDRTFCPFWKDCRLGSECSRALTQEVKDAAAKWWGDENPPIAFYVDEPDCFEMDQ